MTYVRYVNFPDYPILGCTAKERNRHIEVKLGQRKFREKKSNKIRLRYKQESKEQRYDDSVKTRQLRKDDAKKETMTYVAGEENGMHSPVKPRCSYHSNPPHPRRSCRLRCCKLQALRVDHSVACPDDQFVAPADSLCQHGSE